MGRVDAAVQHAEQRLFAGAVRSDDRDQLTRPGAQRNIRHRCPRAVIDRNVACFEHQGFSFSCSDASIRARCRAAGCRQQIRIDKAFALRDFSYLDIQWFAEHWPIESEGMKFSSLTTRIDLLGKS